MTLPASAFPLSVSGAKITRADTGQPIRLAGVNWGGAYQDHRVPSGLRERPREEIIGWIAQRGFNHVRFPFALGSFVTSAGNLITAPAENARLAANPDLQGLSPWEIYCRLVDDMTVNRAAAGQDPLYVMLNKHLMYPGWPMAVTTQILTRSGWKYHHEVIPGDETLGYSSGRLLWTPILRVQQKGSQPVVRFGSGRWSTTCTPDHRWLVQEAFPRNNRPVEWGPVRAESAASAWHSKRTANGIAGARRLVLTGYAEGGASPCTPDEARVIAWLLTDGNITWRSDNGGVTAYITQSESKYAAEIRELLHREDAMTSEATDKHAGYRKTVMRRFRIKAAYVRRIWADYGLEDKDLIRLVLSLSCPARSAFLDAWRKADGSGGQIPSHPGPRLDAVAVAAFCEEYLVQEYSGARHHGINLSYKYKPNNGPAAKLVYEDAGTADVWCPTTGLGSWVARDEDGRIFVTGNCCSGADANGLWYNDSWPSSVYTSTWIRIAERFARNPYVGFDLHNEPRPATIGGAVRTPTWGSNWTGSFPTDFRDMYQRTTGRIRSAVAAAGSSVKHLVACEGLGYAGNLAGWGAKPVTGENILASAHDYPWFHQHADNSAQTWAEYQAQNQARWGYLETQDIVPVWIGECGSNTDPSRELFNRGWFPNFLRWAAERKSHWCWWTLDATEQQGTEPATNVIKVRDGQGEGFGLLHGQDWRGSQVDTLAALAPIMPS